MSALRIAILTETFPPEVNGVAMTLHRLASGLRQNGHTVQVVRPRQKRGHGGPIDFEEVLVAGGPLPGYQGLRFALPCQGRLLQAWRDTAPDVIYVATEGPLGLSGISAARKLNIPVTSGFHTNFNQYMKHYSLPGLVTIATRYLRWVHNRTWCTFTPSSKSKKDLEAMGIRNVRLLGRGVDTELFHPDKRNESLRDSWGIENDGVCAIFVSRMAAEKNLQFTAERFHALKESVPGSQGVFVGDGPEKAPLERDFPDFSYAGMRRGEDLAAHFASGDLFVFPSVTETFGNVVTEAMASGLVVIAYDYAAPHMYIQDGVNGFLAEFDNPSAYEAAIQRAMEARDRWPEIRKAARTTAESLSWNRIVDNFADTLQEAVEACRCE